MCTTAKISSLASLLSHLTLHLTHGDILDLSKRTPSMPLSPALPRVAVTGTCASMCPAAEAAQRRGAKALHELEQWQGSPQLLKRYTRPGADEANPPASDVRTLPALVEATRHLLGAPVLLRHDVSLASCAAFITDRLRAVRADCRMQGFHHAAPAALAMLVAHARYHVCVGYTLGGTVCADFDPAMNDARLLEVLCDCADWSAAASLESPPRDAAAVLDLLAETAAIRLLLSVHDAGEAAAQLRAVCGLAPTVMRHPLYLAATEAAVHWSCGDWRGVLHLADRAAAAGVLPGVSHQQSRILRLVLHRLLPRARAGLLRAFGLALNPREALPLRDAATLLGLGGASSPTAGVAAADGTVGRLQSPGGDDVGGEALGWFHVARMARLLGVEVVSAGSEGGGSGGGEGVVDAARLLELARLARDGDPCPSLSLRFRKGAVVDPWDPSLKARVALMPHPTPSCLPTPSCDEVSRLCLAAVKLLQFE